MVEVELPHWHRRTLERVAVDHAVDVALAYDRPPGDAPVDRLVVNMLRHEFTSYDTDPTQAAHRIVCDATPRGFGGFSPSATGRCSSARGEADERAYAEWAKTTAAAEKAERQAWAAESRQAIGQFSAGMQVKANVKGHARDATVIKVGRTRLTIGFTIKSGAERTAQVYARDVQPA